MDVNKLVAFFEDSFLKDLLNNDKVTDISYNGQDIYYVHNDLGRQKSDLVLDKMMAKDFIRQIANLSEKQFSYSNPELDVSFGRYRFNALHQSVCRKNNEESVCFAIRIASSSLRFKKSNSLSEEVKELLQILINSNVSIVMNFIFVFFNIE